MSAIISALDKFTPVQAGENGHSEYAWSHDIQEQIVQFSFQLVRTKDKTQINKLSAILEKLLQNLSKPRSNDNEELLRVEHLSMLYCMIGQTRDIIDGKGEYQFAYMMICVWYKFFPTLAIHVLNTFVQMPSDTKEASVSHPYGSWKDIKYMCDYCKSSTLKTDHPLVIAAIKLMNDQLRIDDAQTDIKLISLAAKWTARQSSDKFGWVFNALAFDYFKHYLNSAKALDTSPEKSKRLEKARTKALMDYRKLISGLNVKLDTIQVKQCANEWASIDHAKTTSITVMKQKKALLNVTKKGDPRSDKDDRIQCATNFKAYIDTIVKSDKEIKGKRVSMIDFVTQGFALRQQHGDTDIETTILNSQWRDNSSQTNKMGNMIAMVDTSGSMSGDPLHVALGLGIRIAEKSALGKRLMTFSATPRWVNLEHCNTFTEMLAEANYGDWGMNTDFNAALKMVHDAIQDSQTITVEDCTDMVIVVLSDMQMDQGDDGGKWKSLYGNIETKYAALGAAKFGVQLKPPHILFWNLRSTSGFPTLSSQPNASMMSGFSPALLNAFCDRGMESLQDCTPWSLLKESLGVARYAGLSAELHSTLKWDGLSSW
jgi:hypothetical protein